jgi:hypothetical protein
MRTNMGSIIKRTVTEVAFMENVSSCDDIRVITLRLESEGAGRFLILSNGRPGSETYLNSPDDLRVIYETASQLWSQGDVMAPGDADRDAAQYPPTYDDSASRAFGEQK